MSGIGVLVLASTRLERDLLCRAVARDEGLRLESAPETIGIALERLATIEPDVVVLSVRRLESNVLDLVEDVKKRFRGLRRILVVGPLAESWKVARLAKAGAAGFLPTTSSVDELLEAIKCVGQGEYRFESSSLLSLVMDCVEESRVPHLEDLTERECDVLARITRGQSSKEIAAALSLSPRTIDCHRTNIMQKLDLHKVAELVLFAVREGLVSPFDDAAEGDFAFEAWDTAPPRSVRPTPRFEDHDPAILAAHVHRGLTA